MSSSNSSLKLVVFSSFLWRVAEKAGSSVVRFVTSIILGRIIAPEVFGIIAIIAVITSFIDVFIRSGFGKSLIQKENADDIDFSTVFYLTTAISIVAYVLLYFTAPIIANFFEHPQIVPTLRLMSLPMLISGLNIVQIAYASRNMLFDSFFWATLGAVIISSAVAITLAIAGYGIWTLVVHHLVGAVVSTIILWFTLKWRPKLVFSVQRMKNLYSYGWKLLVSNVVHNAYKQLRTLLIANYYSSADVAYFTRGRSFPALIADNSSRAISSVIFPAISKKQKSTETVKKMVRQSVSVTSYLIWPMMIGLAIIAEPLVLLLLTEIWIEAVPFLQIACIYFALLPFNETSTQAINAIGRSDITLKLKIIKTVIGIGILLLVVRHGILIIALSTIPTSIIFSLINILPNSKLINYRFKEQMADVLPYIGMSAIMAVIIYPIQLLQIPGILAMLLQIIAGAVIYLLFSLIFRLRTFYFILDTVKQRFAKRKITAD
ncbi:MAG: lipopolysaccharide biosynthesis protein [Oscillospiraceae bacterium]|nr:lipopolysaccharide biosynthesis protein [Oscillospiraceae bacterium]